MLCYLDFDGVLHCDSVFRAPGRGIELRDEKGLGRRLFEWVDILVDELQPYPDVAVVLSTSWVRVVGYSRALKRLPEALQRRVIGATYHSQAHGQSEVALAAFDSLSRGQQVWADVCRRSPDRWLALDDAAEDWPVELRRHLVRCDSELGLSDPGTRAELAAALATLHRPD